MEECQDSDCHCHRFQGKVAVVTGGAPGIGRETTLQFAQEEARLVICDVNEEGLSKTDRAGMVLAGLTQNMLGGP